MSSQAATEVYDYQIEIKGLWGRNRKKKRILVPIKKGVPRETPINSEQLLPMALDIMADLKVKPGATYQIFEYPIEREEMNGIVLERFMLFSERLMRAGIYLMSTTPEGT